MDQDDLKAICDPPYQRPTPPAPTSGFPSVSPILQATPVQTQARKTAVVKRKATTPPSGHQAKPSQPSQPPKSDIEHVEQWSLQAGRLQQRYAQLVKLNLEDVRKLISMPKHEAYQHLPTSRAEGDFAFHRVKLQEGRNAVCVTIRRTGFYHQGLLLQEMHNPTLHRVLKTISGKDYRPIVTTLAASTYPQLDVTDFIGTP
ncbi:uncharacterized protein LOC121392813 [Gigantopelta aegis]|uniref:uncharacterized protein LOC121392813 n=1 Tax=Gigantopelta aegis TaxID=1735272 RepID=UPI001B88DB02|nr:uncharacterized protein LOC121392813 [Gigantopelta aegis]